VTILAGCSDYQVALNLPAALSALVGLSAADK